MRRKRKPQIIKEINKLKLQKDDTLVVHFDIENFDLDDYQKMYNIIIGAFPKNNILALFGNTKLEIINHEKIEKNE